MTTQNKFVELGYECLFTWRAMADVKLVESGHESEHNCVACCVVVFGYSEAGKAALLGDG